MNKKKPELETILREEVLKGVARLPAPFFNSPTAFLSDLDLEHYEVTPVEPLHDIKDHIKNPFEELFKHLEGMFVSLLSLLFCNRTHRICYLLIDVLQRIEHAIHLH